ncbi:MAG: PHP domain-containing protein [Myxococcota bacterium]
MHWVLAAVLTGVLHVHHAPSHDSDARFREVLAAGFAAGLDFIVLTEHVPPDARGALPAADRAGRYPRPGGGELLVLVGAEYGTRDGHLLAFDVPRLLPIEGLSGREGIAEIHHAGGFAVLPHPFLHGGWKDWEAPFDGLEVHNGSAVLWDALDFWLPFRLLRYGGQPLRIVRSLLTRPDHALEVWEELLAAGRPVVAFSGADAHQNLSLLGIQLDPYQEIFGLVQTHCPPGPLEARSLWWSLRSGACWIRYSAFDARAREAREVRFPSGRTELQLDGGQRVLEIRQPRGGFLR